LTGASADDDARSRLPDYIVRQATGPYRSLNPTTKLVIALVEAALVFVVGGWQAPIAVLAVVAGAARIAGVLRQLGAVVAVTAPVVASILLINTFLFPGATDPILRIGPLAPTWSGLQFGIEVTLRLLAVSLALALVYLTTGIDDLLADLERRGLGRRAIFVVGAGLQTVPRMVERAGEIVDAQRARGLDTEGPFWQRARGIVPLAAPLIFSGLTEVEERTVALEARGFSAPGRRTALRVPSEHPLERPARWLLVATLGVALAFRLVGLID
jgi:energy-coupling factor transport system permease protein